MHCILVDKIQLFSTVQLDLGEGGGKAEFFVEETTCDRNFVSMAVVTTALACLVEKCREMSSGVMQRNV